MIFHGRLATAAPLPVGVTLGAVLALAFPPYGWWPLAPLVVAAVTLLVRPDRLRQAALLGLATGLGFFLVLLLWLRVVGYDAWIALSVLEALFFALLGTGLAAVRRLPWWPLWTACLWVAVDLAREYLPFGGFPWGRLAFAQSDSPYRALASVGGLAALTFSVALTGSLLAAAVLARRTARRLALVLAAVALPAVALVLPLPVDGKAATLAVIQGNVPTSGLDAFGQRQAVLNNHVQATLKLAADIAAGNAPSPQVVLWPENASDIDPFADPAAAAVIQSAVDAIGVPILVGAVSANPADRATVLNLGILWAPTKSTRPGPGDQYAKRHPVPFGEYLPLRSLLSSVITRFDRIPRDFAAGHRPGLFDVGRMRLGDVICFEVAYDQIVRDVVNGGAQALVVQTNNATYGHTGQPEQQFAMARLRAIETGRSVLVAATSGLSGVIAPDGRVLAGSAEFESWVYDGPVTLRSPLTLASRAGSWPERILGTLGMVALLAATVRRRRERSTLTHD